MPKLTCDREFGARYSILDYCLDKLYASGIKDDTQAVINCYDVAKNIKDYKLPRKAANIICNAYASCEDQKLCPKVLKRDIVFKTTCGRRLLPEGNEIVDQPMHDFNQEGEEDEDAMQARKLHEQFEKYRARVDNADNYHEGDVMEGKFILNSLRQINSDDDWMDLLLQLPMRPMM